GRRLFERVAPAFRDIEDALEDLNAFRGKPIGRLRINSARASAQMVLLPRVTRFLAENPGVQVELAIDNAAIDMVSAGFDAGVRFGEIVAQDMVAVPLGPRQRSAIVASPAFFEGHRKPVAPQELRELPCILLRFSDGRLYHWEFERGGIEVAIEVKGALTLDDQALAIEAALDGAGIAYAFEEQVSALVASHRLVRVLEEWCPYYPGFYLYYPSRRQMPAVLRSVVEHLKSTSRVGRIQPLACHRLDIHYTLGCNVSVDRLTNVLTAVSHPARRAMIGQLARGPARFLDVAQRHDTALNAVTKHLKMLERA